MVLLITQKVADGMGPSAVKAILFLRTSGSREGRDHGLRTLDSGHLGPSVQLPYKIRELEISCSTCRNFSLWLPKFPLHNKL